MIRFLKVSTLIGVGFVAGVVGMHQALKDEALVVSNHGNVLVTTTPKEYLKHIPKRILLSGKDEEG
jgi:hypothetical protein